MGTPVTGYGNTHDRIIWRPYSTFLLSGSISFMRFIADGPDIPHELLIARDQGRVVLFCGAGVSRAKAGLPDFKALTHEVVRRLGASSDAPARKILDQLNVIEDIEQAAGVKDLLPIDRIFGLLESEFEERDIEQAVAMSLHPPNSADLSAHKMLLDIATTPQGQVRLVTTNFDRLFSDANPKLTVAKPRHLPNPSTMNEISGIMHLHGRVNSDYTSAESDSLILSTSEFGNAYISDAWATRFVGALLERFVVLFVGYGANDPPIHYLLEGLRKKAVDLSGVYAFQSDDAAETVESWQQKGVQPISYRTDSSHSRLWNTLDLWAARARDPEGWYDNIVELAIHKPEQLTPYQRGQVAHVFSMTEGTRRFAEAAAPPPANWLLVFDANQRFSRPTHLWHTDSPGQVIDPFKLYCLDSDPLPAQVDPDQPTQERHVPSNVWDGLSDDLIAYRKTHRIGSTEKIRIYGNGELPLTSRLVNASNWICRVSNQPTALWWAAHQVNLRQFTKESLRWRLRNENFEILEPIRWGWRYLLDAWSISSQTADTDYFSLGDWIEGNKWTAGTLRQFISLSAPHLVASRPYGRLPSTNNHDGGLDVHSLVRLEIEYPIRPFETEIPNQWLQPAIRGLRKNLELAVDLETEVGGYALQVIGPIRRSTDPHTENYMRGRGLTAHVLNYAKSYERLADRRPSAARAEMEAWPTDDDYVFARLRMWVIGNPKLVSPSQLIRQLGKVSRDAFWEPYHQRDLLISLKQRWGDLAASSREKIEKRILKGPRRYPQEGQDEYNERKATIVHQRLRWLLETECQLSRESLTQIERIEGEGSRYRKIDSKRAIDSLEPRGGQVHVDSDPTSLLGLPITQVIPTALDKARQPRGFLTEKRPFSGLASKYPVRAFRALDLTARSEAYPEEAWRDFLTAQGKNCGSPRFVMCVAERLASYPQDALSTLINAICEWLKEVGECLIGYHSPAFDKLFHRLCEILKKDPTKGDSAIASHGEGRDLVMEAINAPAGKLAQVVMLDPRKRSNDEGVGLLPEWRKKAERLLSIPGRPHIHTVLIFSHNLHWFYAHDPAWTEKHLLSKLDDPDSIETDALWSGYFLSQIQITPELIKRLKQPLLDLVCRRERRRRKFLQGLAIVLLCGWAKTYDDDRKYIGDSEFRDALLRGGDEFRHWVLWYIEGRLDESNIDQESWISQIMFLFERVWPRQRAAKSPETSKELAEFLFRNSKIFSEVAPLIKPHLANIKIGHMLFPDFGIDEQSLIEQFPADVLDILYAILPRDTSGWPYNTGKVLQRLGRTDEAVKSDWRFLELERLWKSR